MQRWIPLLLATLAACGGGATKPAPKKPPPTTTPPTTTPPPATTTTSACGCTTEACRASDFDAYFEAAFCTWREQTCACADQACAQRALGPINDFKRSLVGTTMKLPPADVIERMSKHADEANACIAKLGASTE